MQEQTPVNHQVRDLVVVRLFAAPVEQVWRAWTTSEDVMRWWGPTGFTCLRADMDVREGGVSLVCMRAPKEFGGQDLYNTWTYRRIVPGKEIEFILNFTDKDGNAFEPEAMGMPPGIPKDVRHVITFEARPDGTELTVTEHGYTSDAVVEMSRAGLEQ
ncbi:MAG: SRPBCC domain-containing protein, partial [Gemmataceae bacterium]